jgi:hypothetical protein
MGERSEVWVSYQIVVEAVDGVPTSYRAEDPGLYHCLALPAGEHRLTLRLDYRAPLEDVRSGERVELDVRLAPGAAYRLLDLNAGRRRGRVFTPWLLDGAPAEETIELERPAPR